jgi:hypothetical protein
MIPLSPPARRLLSGRWPLFDRAPSPDFAAVHELIAAGLIVEEPAEGMNLRHWCLTVRGLDAKRKL